MVGGLCGAGCCCRQTVTATQTVEKETATATEATLQQPSRRGWERGEGACGAHGASLRARGPAGPVRAVGTDGSRNEWVEARGMMWKAHT
eukprot:2254535-Rhodomonas_salina.2